MLAARGAGGAARGGRSGHCFELSAPFPGNHRLREGFPRLGASWWPGSSSPGLTTADSTWTFFVWGEAEEPLGQKPPSRTRVGGCGPRDRPEGHTAAPGGHSEGSKRSGALAEAPSPGGWADWRWGVWPRTTVATSLGRHVGLVGAQNRGYGRTEPRVTELGPEPPPLASSGRPSGKTSAPPPPHHYRSFRVAGVFPSLPSILISTVFEYYCLRNCHWLRIQRARPQPLPRAHRSLFRSAMRQVLFLEPPAYPTASPGKLVAGPRPRCAG